MPPINFKQPNIRTLSLSLLLGSSLLTSSMLAFAGHHEEMKSSTQEATEEATKTSPKNNGEKMDMKKPSYAIGLKYGEGFRKDLQELDIEAFQKGLNDAFHDKPRDLDTAEVEKILSSFQEQKREEIQQAQAEKAENNLKQGKAFLAENSKKENVKTTESGLQYLVVKEGEGNAPGPNDTVSVHYEGTLIDGTVFDSSRKRGEPVEFPVKGVIKGWTEALQLMKPGANYKLFIPADLAYGERGTPGSIGPNATLIFDVELLKIVKEEKKK